ncbi:hypothetical protein PIB30_020505 [Stylosanthes scabra]|uniref:Sec-independent protein translocase protein TATC, chloroplastic n=1 Tax=Stylosanthes scabra TaxID=79078 RepID=A0ABU6X6T6_9FABA|nr:hypothetical protein [Stylosanthes scabra]
MGLATTTTVPMNIASHLTSSSFSSSVRVSNFSKTPSLSFTLSRRKQGRLGRFPCFAVDDDLRIRQQDVANTTSTAVGSATEERPTENTDLLTSTNGDALDNLKQDGEGNAIYDFLYPSKELLPDDKEMSIFDHLEELRQRIFVSVLAGVRFLQLGPGEFFFTTLKVSGYCGLLLGSPVILYEIIAFVLPGLTKAERKFLGPIVLGSSVLFYAGITFSYFVLTPAALNFFVNYAEGAVESLWSIDQYFEFVLVLMFSTGLSFQVPVIQFLLGQLGLVSGDQMLSVWRYVVVGAVVAAAIVTPSTDPLTQVLLAAPLLGLYLGGAWAVKLTGR